MLFSVFAFTGCKSDPPKMIYPEVSTGQAVQNTSNLPDKNEIEKTNIEKAFEDLRQFYHTYALNRTDIVLIQVGKFRGHLMIGKTGIPLKAVTAHYNLGTEENEVGFICNNDIPCIDSIKMQKSYPGVYFYFNSKESCLKFIQKFETLKALL